MPPEPHTRQTTHDADIPPPFSAVSGRNRIERLRDYREADTFWFFSRHLAAMTDICHPGTASPTCRVFAAESGSG